MNLKLRAKNYIESFNCKLLSEYKNRNEIISIQCKCGEIINKTFKQFADSKLKCCTGCAYKLRKHNKLTQEQVANCIAKNNCELISEYIDANSSIFIKCSCGHIAKTTFARFKNYNITICNKCAVKKRAKEASFSFELVKQFIEDSGCKLLSAGYKNANTPMLLQCRCNNTWRVDFHTFQRSKYKACKICSSKETGIKLTKYTKEERLKRLKETRTYHYRVLRRYILERDNYTCKKCNINPSKNSKKLNVHHLFNRASFPKWKYKSINLITLCSGCHKQFHKQFGLVNNTPKQMKIYLKGNK